METAIAFSIQENHKFIECQIGQYESGDILLIPWYTFPQCGKVRMDKLVLRFRGPALARSERKRGEKSSRFLCEQLRCVSLKGIGEG